MRFHASAAIAIDLALACAAAVAPAQIKAENDTQPLAAVMNDRPGADEDIADEQASCAATLLLRARRLAVPVVGVAREDLHDNFEELRGTEPHHAIDVVARAGTPVVAVEDGTVAKLFVSVAGGLTVYQFDPEVAYAYYYAHLDRYAASLHEGQVVMRGEVIGYVGTTGNAGGTAHLHFAIFKLGSEKRWWEGRAINPYPVLRDITK